MKAKDIKPPARARRTVTPASDDLRESLRKYGQLQPIIVRRKTGEVIIGDRRRRSLGDAEAKVVVMDLDETEALQMRLSEEFSKKDMTMVERGEGLSELQRLLEKNGDKITYATLAKGVGTTEGTVQAYIQLAKLPGPVKTMAQSGKVGYREAEALARGDLRGSEKTVLARKFATGKAPGGTKARQVVDFAEHAPTDVRKHLTGEARTTYWEAQAATERKAHKARQQSTGELAAMKASAFWRRVLQKVKAWAMSFDTLTELAPTVPKEVRGDLKRWMQHLRSSIDRFIEKMDEDDQPAPKRVLALIDKTEGEFE